MIENNQRTINIKLKRGELIDVLLACALYSLEFEKMTKIHNKIYEQMKDQDRKWEEKHDTQICRENVRRTV